MVSEFGESKNLQLGFKYDCDTLLIPQVSAISLTHVGQNQAALVNLRYQKTHLDGTLIYSPS